ncbi:uncharacterized protein LOC122639995 [Telopea speciosissima]|uniref:uncharacterized protein LOC122639995 n=1 Tax=Telopea speciosissima TaxID=54955 RepID=UPI001CC43FC5|nr:uncharacterized protein LOC122639995 [Telopea speciosissima]
MDRIKCQKLQTGIKFEKTQFLKKTLQLLISICVFFFFLSYSATFSFLELSFNLYFSTFSFQLFDHTIDRNYMFLLCNGILFFLAMNSGLISYSSVETDKIHDEFQRRNRDDLQRVNEMPEKKASASEEVVVLERIQTSENALGGGGGGGGGNGCLITVEDGNGYLIAVGRESGFLTAGAAATSTSTSTSTAAAETEEEVEEEENEEGNGWISTEELNKKCEDFIRKMKQGIRSEAQRQLVMV